MLPPCVSLPKGLQGHVQSIVIKWVKLAIMDGALAFNMRAGMNSKIELT